MKAKSDTLELNTVDEQAANGQPPSIPKRKTKVLNLERLQKMVQQKLEPNYNKIDENVEDDLLLSSKSQDEHFQEVEIILQKVNGSLGFKLLSGPKSKNGSGVFVESLISGGAALTDGKIRPGDEIIAVNGIKILNTPYPKAVQLIKDSPISCRMIVKRNMAALISNNEWNWSNNEWNWNNNESFQEKPTLASINNYPNSDSLKSSSYINSLRSTQVINEISKFDSSILKRFNITDTIEIVQVNLKRSSRGFGMRISGGSDFKSNDPLDKLIRVIFLVPSEPASQSGLINVGDILIEANGKSMIGISIIESLYILHSSLDNLTLKVLKSSLVKSISKPFSNFNSQNIQSSVPEIIVNSSSLYSQFDIKLTKKDGNLGFTIAKIDSEGFFIKELTKEPAILDKRIAPWDKIIRVNGIDISSMTWNGAITYLRSLPDCVEMTLERFNRNTSNQSLDTEENDHQSVKKPLRLEVIAMYVDKKLAGSNNRLKVRNDRRRSRDTSRDRSGDRSSEEADVKHQNSCDGVTLLRENKDTNLNHSPSSRAASPSYFNSIDWNLQSSDRFHHKSIDSPESLFSRHFSVNSKTQNSSSFRDNNFIRWRGTNLLSDDTNEIIANGDDDDDDNSTSEDCNGSFITRDEQDSGFGESTLLSNKESLIMDEKNYNMSYNLGGFDLSGQVLEITLDRGWQTRLGFTLTDCDLSMGQLKACRVKSIFPNSIAAKDGRIKVDDILLQVNNELLINRPASEVISDLRKIKKKLYLTFLRPCHH